MRLEKFKISFIFFTLLYICFFTKSWGSVTGFIYTHDDVVYYAQTVSLANDFDTDISNNLGTFASGEWRSVGSGINDHAGRVAYYEPVGTSLLYLVPYILTKPLVYFISYLRGVAFNEYDPIFFVVLSFFTLILFYFAGIFLKKALMLFFSEAMADIITIFTLWGTILPVYVFRRPIYAVIPEFFLTVLLLYWLMRWKQREVLSISKVMVLGILCGALLITRWNDLHIAFFCFVVIVSAGWRSVKIQAKKIQFFRYAFLFAAVALLFFFLTQGVVWLSNYGSIKNFISFYTNLTREYLSLASNLGINVPRNGWLKNVIHIMFGLDWGLLFTMPVLLVGGIAFIFGSGQIFKHYRIFHFFLAVLTFTFPFFIVLLWKNTGDFFGYRFLVSLLPFSAIGYAAFLENKFPQFRKINAAIIVVFCILNFFIILPFEYVDATTLTPGYTAMGGYGWRNNAYFINAIMFYFQSGFTTLVGAFSRGYLAAFIFGALSIIEVDLARFGPKVKIYFSLTGYKEYVSFLFLAITLCWLYLLNKINFFDRYR